MTSSCHCIVDERTDKRSPVAWPSSRFIVLSLAERGGSGLHSAAQGSRFAGSLAGATARVIAGRIRTTEVGDKATVNLYDFVQIHACGHELHHDEHR